MTRLSGLRVGMPVFATDGAIGRISTLPRLDLDDPTLPGEIIVLADRTLADPNGDEFFRVNHKVIDHVNDRGMYLNVPRDDVPRVSAVVAATQRLKGTGEDHGVPLLEEELAVQHGVVEVGTVRVLKKVDQLIDEQSLQLRHHEVDVERVPVDEIVPQYVEPYMDGDVFVVPIIEEEIVVERRLRLKELLRVRRVIGEHRETLRVPYRRERVVIEEHWRDASDQESAAKSE